MHHVFAEYIMKRVVFWCVITLRLGSINEQMLDMNLSTSWRLMQLALITTSDYKYNCLARITKD